MKSTSTSLKLTSLALLLAAGPVVGQLNLFQNPDPAFEHFGSQVVPLGSDKVLIGYVGAPKVYLFDLSGHLLQTFSRPEGHPDMFFGLDIAAVGTDKVLIGAPEFSGGAVFLYDLEGNLLRTFADPDSTGYQHSFGMSVALVGGDKILVGVGRGFDYEANRVYVFDMEGNLLRTITAPSDPWADDFGIDLIAVGTDKVLILGGGYLFDLEGNLLVQFLHTRHPVSSAAVLGDDKVALGVPEMGDLSEIGYPGMVFVFDLDGHLLNTISDPSPQYWGHFGVSVAAVGTDKVLVGSFGESLLGADEMSVSEAYLFDLQGNLEATFSGPNGGYLGPQVGAVGTEHILVRGPSVDAVSLFRVQDITRAPQISCPPDVSVQFMRDVPSRDFIGTVSDPVDPNPSVRLIREYFASGILYTQPHSASYLYRVFRATNADGLSRDCTQTITIQSGSADVNGDGTIEITDLYLILYGLRTHDTKPYLDANGDGRVDIADARYVAMHFTNPGGAP